MSGDPIGYGGFRDGTFVPRQPRRGRGLGGVVLLVVLLAAAAAGLVVHARLSGCPLWAVRRVEVEGNRSLGMVELLQRLHLGPGTPWWRVSPGAIRKLRSEEPRIAEITVSWRWPRDLVVKVRERESFLRVWGDPPLELASDGMLLESKEELDPADLPLLTGELPRGLAANTRLELADAGDAWKEFLALSRDYPATWRDVSEIHYTGGRDFQVFLRQGRRVILWEAGINGDLKKTIPELVADMRKLGQEDAVLDLRFRDQVVVRLPEAADSVAAAPASTKGVTPRKTQAPDSGHGRRRA
jgi:cell division septal protein FtsQ